MMNRIRYSLLLAAGLALLLLGALMGSFLGSIMVKAQEETAVSTATPSLLQYQGRLSDPATGEALPDGDYPMALRLYSAPTGGTPLWQESKQVIVQNGLFSTLLGQNTPLDQALFNGQPLWLGIKVGDDPEAAPRQQVLPVAYALSLIPGATIWGDSGDPALTVQNAGSGPALQLGGDLDVDGQLHGGAHTHSGADIASGKVDEPRIANSIARDSELSSAMNSHAAQSNAHHNRYTDQEAAEAALAHPNIVTQYDLDDHIYGGMHSGRAIAFGTINGDATVASSSGNISSRWNNTWKCFEITIDGHDYEWQSYATVVTSVTGGIAAAWDVDGNLCVGIYLDSQSPAQKTPFHFVVFQP